MKLVNIHEAKTHFSQLIKAVDAGDEIIIGRFGKPVAKLIPFNANSAPRQLGGSWEGKVHIADDFDDLADDFLDHFTAG
ncbi:MAG: type II toxin-antitoxin system prevent-host-death family antitoxin [Legionellales bacterium]|nr:MAG: type II toxin-antitoxin system prevent-host-death family antitoxin [Legionellales bacterium]